MSQLYNPLVSIIIPCFNAEKYLSQALESVLWQTYTHWECLLVDDGSTDDGAKVYAKYQELDSRFLYMYQTNGGAAVARNTGILAAQGEYIQLLDADDILMPQKLELCVAQLTREKKFDAVYSDYVVYDRYRGFWHSVPGNIPGDDAFHALLFENNITFVTLLHAFLFKREILLQHLFNVELDSYGEDVECWIRMAVDDVAFGYVDEKLIVYRSSENTLSKNETKILQAKLNILKNYETSATARGYGGEYQKTEAYLLEKLILSYFKKRQFRMGWAIARSHRSNMNVLSFMRLTVWSILFLSIPWHKIEKVRTFFISHNLIRWGGWKHFQHWQPTRDIQQIMHL